MGNDEFAGLSDSPETQHQRRAGFARQRFADFRRHVALFVVVCLGCGAGGAIGALTTGQSERAGPAFVWAAGSSLVGGLLGLLGGIYLLTRQEVRASMRDERDTSDGGAALYFCVLAGGILAGAYGSARACPDIYFYAAGGGVLAATVAWSARRIIRRSGSGARGWSGDQPRG